eukprot:TRINITY_DN72134_c0_g1_i1.p1 TRINITY_DN72134_c0_g1~~TRINITY_DN72134_c0_g1_i1.p1  ORF type:complete len:346 (+),score=153.13 TRINITY_DN72134_c0_g1_i1:77-1039(+)
MPLLRPFAGAILAASCGCLATATETLTPANGLQALAGVEEALHKMLNGKTDKALLKVAKPVVELVDKTVHEVESGNFSKQENAKKVLVAIKALQGLQGEWEGASKALAKQQKLESLERELNLKKAELMKQEDMLKLEKMKKELAEKKQQLQVLTREKEEAQTHRREQQEDAQQASAVASLVKQAKELSVSRHDKDAVPKPLQGILSNLEAHAANVSAALDRMDADEKKREAELDQLALKPVPSAGKTDAINKGKAMIRQLKKQEQRSYKKARVMKKAQLNELNEGIRAVKKGDVAALSSLMTKMQSEMKFMTTKKKGFLV